MNIQYHIIRLGITNCYLISTGNDYLLIDTSTKKKYSEFRKKIDCMNIKLSQIKYVFLTHHHLDHTGFLNRILLDSNAELIIHASAVPWIEVGKNNPLMKGTTSLIRAVMKLQNKLLHEKINERVKIEKSKTHIITEDANLPGTLSFPAKIICLPGHTADSIGLVFDDGNAFVGDAAINILNFLGLKNMPIVAENQPKIWLSWKKIQHSGGRKIFVSHGKSINIDTLLNKIPQ